MKANVRAIGERLELEVQSAVLKTALACRATPLASTPGDVAIQIDAGYIKSTSRVGGRRWISAIASKLVHPKIRRTHAHAYATAYDPRQGLRQQAFLSSVGITPDTPVVVLSDGGEDISYACQLPAASERVLDWFHIGMRFEHLLQGLGGADADVRASIKRRAEGAKWLLWHGRHAQCLERLEALRRDTGWAGVKNPLGRLLRYLRGCAKFLVNYGQRRARGQPISSAGAESAVDYVIGQRMKRNGHMRWTREGANALLPVRCEVLNGQDIRNFKRWYPPDRRISGSAVAVLNT